VFGVLIAIGIFLSVASIIAVPIFQEDQKDSSNIPALDIASELDNYLPDSSAFYTKYSIIVDSLEAQSIGVLASAEVDNWNDLVSSTYSMIVQNKDRAVGRLNSAIEEKLTADAKVDYMRLLVEWFLNSKTSLIEDLNKDRPHVNTWINQVYQMNLISASGNAVSSSETVG